MSEIQPTSRGPSPDKTLAYLAWITCILGMWPVGLIIAYIDRGKVPPWLASHYRYLIRSCWIGLLYVVIGILLTLIVIGAFLLVLAGAWFLIRCVKGLVYVYRDEPIDKPGTWLV